MVEDQLGKALVHLYQKPMKDKRKFACCYRNCASSNLLCNRTNWDGITMRVSDNRHGYTLFCKQKLDGISGDVLGASNEISRLSSLIVIFSFNL